MACGSKQNASTGTLVMTFFMLLITSAASMCDISICSRMLEMAILTSVVDISLGNSTMMSPSDGMSKF